MTRRRSLEHGRERPARPAPFRPEVDENRLVSCEEGIKVVFGELNRGVGGVRHRGSWPVDEMDACTLCARETGRYGSRGRFRSIYRRRWHETVRPVSPIRSQRVRDPRYTESMSTILLLTALGLTAPANASCTPARQGDDVRIHVLTTTQGGKIFDGQGHTAIWVSGGSLEDDMVYNWGAFDGRRDDLLPAFLSGRMEFWLAAEVYEVQWRRTVNTDRSLFAQRLERPGAGEDRQAAQARLPPQEPRLYLPLRQQQLRHQGARRHRRSHRRTAQGTAHRRRALDRPLRWGATSRDGPSCGLPGTSW